MEHSDFIKLFDLFIYFLVGGAYLITPVYKGKHAGS